MVTMAQSSANWRNTLSRGSHAFTHTYINTEKGPLSIRPTLELFQGSIGETPKRRGRANIGLAERIDAILN